MSTSTFLCVESLAEEQAAASLAREYPGKVTVTTVETPHSKQLIIDCESQALRDYVWHELMKVRQAVRDLTATGIKAPPPMARKFPDPGVTVRLYVWPTDAKLMVTRQNENGSGGAFTVEEIRNQGVKAHGRLARLRKRGAGLAKMLGVPFEDDGRDWLAAL